MISGCFRFVRCGQTDAKGQGEKGQGEGEKIHQDHALKAPKGIERRSKQGRENGME